MKKNKQKRNRCHHKRTKHHIIPQSRLKGKGILNVCKVDGKIHSLSHDLFGNMTPPEICVWLNETLWDNQYQITITKKGA